MGLWYRFFFFFFNFNFFGCATCHMEFVSLTSDETHVSALEVGSLNHLTAKEVLNVDSFKPHPQVIEHSHFNMGNV